MTDVFEKAFCEGFEEDRIIGKIEVMQRMLRHYELWEEYILSEIEQCRFIFIQAALYEFGLEKWDVLKEKCSLHV